MDWELSRTVLIFPPTTRSNKGFGPFKAVTVTLVGSADEGIDEALTLIESS